MNRIEYFPESRDSELYTTKNCLQSLVLKVELISIYDIFQYLSIFGYIERDKIGC